MLLPQYITNNLKEGEEVIRVVRRYPLVLALPISFGILVLLADFFFLSYFFQKGWGGVLFFFLLLIGSAVYISRLWVEWTHNMLIITTQRIIDIDQRGFFSKTVSECTYEKVQDVSFSMKGIWQTLFRFGSVLIQTASSQPNLEIFQIQHPEKIQELITTTQQESLKRGIGKSSNRLNAEDLVQIIQKLKKELGEDNFQELLKKKE